MASSVSLLFNLLVLIASVQTDSIRSGYCNKDGESSYAFHAATTTSSYAILPTATSTPKLEIFDLSNLDDFLMTMMFYDCSDGTWRYTLRNTKKDAGCGSTGNNCLLEKSSTQLQLKLVADPSPDELIATSSNLFDWLAGLSVVESAVQDGNTYLGFDDNNNIVFVSSPDDVPVWWSLPVTKKEVEGGVYVDPFTASYCGDMDRKLSDSVTCTDYILSLTADTQTSKGVNIATVISQNPEATRRKRGAGLHHYDTEQPNHRPPHRKPDDLSQPRVDEKFCKQFISDATLYNLFDCDRFCGKYFGITLCFPPPEQDQEPNISTQPPTPKLQRPPSKRPPSTQQTTMLQYDEAPIITFTPDTTPTSTTEVPTTSTFATTTEKTVEELHSDRFYVFDLPIVADNGKNYYSAYEAAVFKVPNSDTYLSSNLPSLSDEAPSGDAQDLRLILPNPGTEPSFVNAHPVNYRQYTETRTRTRTACGLADCPFSDPSRSGVPLAEQTHLDERFFRVHRIGGGKIKLESFLQPGYFLGFATTEPNIPLLLIKEVSRDDIIFAMDESSFPAPILPPPQIEVPS